MNLFDNAKWLKIPKLKQLDEELLNYIDHLYNEFPELHYTDDEWVNILKWQIDFNNKRIIKFINKYLFNKVNNSANTIIMYMLIKCNLNRFNNIIKKLDIGDIHSILANLNFSINTIFTHKNHIKNFKYLHLFLTDYELLYREYIAIRFKFVIYSVVIPHLLFKYLSSYETYRNYNIDRFLIDYKNRQQLYTNNDNINNDDKQYLFYLINNEYIQKMQPFAYNLYDYYIQRFITSPNFHLFNILLFHNIRPINNKQSLKMIEFIKNHIDLLNDPVLKKMILSCKLTIDQIDELKAYKVLSSI